MPGPNSRRDPVDQLRRAGLRVTSHRVAVLEVLARRPHADAGLIHQKITARIGTASVQAVYDVLTALSAAGLLRRIEPAGLPALYERRTDDNHHHLVCRRCHTIADVECRLEQAPCLSLPDTQGFTVDEAEIVFWGLCPSCARHAASPATSTNPAPSRRTS